MLVTPLRDGMNLVAKEYIACRHDDAGVLVLSEFTGAARELTSALLVNPHDTDGVKAAVARALEMPPRRGAQADEDAAPPRQAPRRGPVGPRRSSTRWACRRDAGARRPGIALAELARVPTLLVALDFDGVLAPIVQDPSTSRPLPGSAAAVRGAGGPAGHDRSRCSPGGRWTTCAPCPGSRAGPAGRQPRRRVRRRRARAHRCAARR